MSDKPKVMISFREDGKNGGPYNSHSRIMNSDLKNKYEFKSLVIPSGRMGAVNLKLLLKLYRDIKEYKPDIVHSAGLQLEGFYFTVAARLAGVKNTVLAIHGSSMEAIELSGIKRSILRVYEAITLCLNKSIYGVSEYVCKWKRVKRRHKKCYGYIYNISNIVQEKNDVPKSLREELGIKENDIVIASTGRITKEKGYEVLWKAIKHMNVPENVKFVIAGDGDFLNTLKNEVRDNNMGNTVFLLGYRQDIDDILRESDIFLICTLHETLCMSLLEAGNYSLPSVATRVGGIPEIIDVGYNGYLTEKYDYAAVADALNLLIKDGKKRKAMGQNAKNVVKAKFDSKKILTQIDDLYRSLLK